MRLPTPVSVLVLAAMALLAAACSDTSDDPVAAGGATSGDATATSGDQSDQSTSGDGTASPTLPPAGDGDGGTSTDASDGQTDGDGTTAGGDDGTPTEPWDQLDLVLQPVGSLTQPIALATRPGSDDLWVVERDGRVRLIERSIDAAAGTEQLTQSTQVVVDITDQVDAGGEGGLLGIAFSADGNTLYLHYTNRDFVSIVSEMPIGTTTADRSAERVLLQVPQPFSNHNGGDIHLGPDGLLYTAIGDGGSADDPLGSGQDTSTVLGAMLRIDPSPSADLPYTIPGDNPFAGGGGAPEIWSWGLRNPWRFSFDRATGDLWIGDVGQGRVEEIDFVANPGDGSPGRAANFGWNLVEGNDRFAGDAPPDHVGPLHTYGHDNNRCSVTGGYVYRGALTPSLDGVYIFADYCSNEIFGIERLADGSTRVANLRLDREPTNVISFGQGPDGEVYVLEQGGRISRLQAADLSLATTLGSS